MPELYVVTLLSLVLSAFGQQCPRTSVEHSAGVVVVGSVPLSCQICQVHKLEDNFMQL